MFTKRIVLFVVMVIVVGLFGAGSAVAQLKFGYVVIEKVYTTYQPAIDAQKTMETEQGAIQKEIARMEDEIRTSQQQLEQQSLLLSEKAKQDRAREIQAMYARLQQVYQDKQQELAKRQEELLTPVNDKIRAAIKKVSDTEGYDFIMDSLNFLDVKEKYDLTDKILKELGVVTTAVKPDKK
ncbi:MAG: OmpH family outer membrane protein [bacterium]